MRTSLNVPDEVLESFDETWRTEGIESRSRAVREAMQEYVESHSELEAASGTVIALVAFDYRHDPVVGDLHALQHEYDDVIDTMTHSHQGEWCLETLFCRGDAEPIRELVYRLKDFDAVNRVTVMLLPADGNGHTV